MTDVRRSWMHREHARGYRQDFSHRWNQRALPELAHPMRVRLTALGWIRPRPPFQACTILYNVHNNTHGAVKCTDLMVVRTLSHGLLTRLLVRCLSRSRPCTVTESTGSRTVSVRRTAGRSPRSRRPSAMGAGPMLRSDARARSRPRPDADRTRRCRTAQCEIQR